MDETPTETSPAPRSARSGSASARVRRTSCGSLSTLHSKRFRHRKAVMAMNQPLWKASSSPRASMAAAARSEYCRAYQA